MDAGSWSNYTHDYTRSVLSAINYQPNLTNQTKHPITYLCTKEYTVSARAPAYHDAYLKEFWTAKKETRTEHINAIKLKGDMNNNKMERMNGEVRDREKVFRGLKKKDTPILKGYQLFHNYIREHEGLEGKTPAEACGIDVQGDNKWKTIIQNASKKR